VEPGFFHTNTTSPQLLDNRLNALWQRAPESVKEEYGKEFVSACSKAASDHINWMCDGNGKNGVQKVVDAYYHALTAKWPRQRYYPGRDMKLILCILWLPTSFLDFAQLAYMKIRGYPVPKACQ